MRVLVVEDDSFSQHRLSRLLKTWGYDPHVVGSGTEAWEILQSNNSPSLMVLDWLMPGISGVELCTRLRQQSLQRYVYILLVTSKDSPDDIVKGLEAGADDYVVKPFNANELQARLNAGRRIVALQTELIAAREELRTQATHDAMTGLWNRAGILEVLNMELARSRRQQSTGALALLDLDHFKSINDTHGHARGDTVLCEAASRMKQSLRAYDTIGRYGGEEFLAVLPGCGADSAFRLATRLKSVLARPMMIGTTRTTVTCSAGVVIWNGKEIGCNLDSAALISAADVALYRAKDMGRNRVEMGSTPHQSCLLSNCANTSDKQTSDRLDR